MYAISLAIIPNGDHFVVCGYDRKIILLNFQSGKSILRYDYTMKVYDAPLENIQAAGSYLVNGNGMDLIYYSYRVAREKLISDTTIK